MHLLDGFCCHNPISLTSEPERPRVQTLVRSALAELHLVDRPGACTMSFSLGLVLSVAMAVPPVSDGPVVTLSHHWVRPGQRFEIATLDHVMRGEFVDPATGECLAATSAFGQQFGQCLVCRSLVVISHRFPVEFATSPPLHRVSMSGMLAVGYSCYFRNRNSPSGCARPFKRTSTR